MSRSKKNPNFVNKVCKFCNKTYTVSFYNRNRSLYCNKKCANSDDGVLQKIRESKQKTYDEKYNGLHPMQTEKTKNNHRDAILKKYGVTSYSKLGEYREKVKKTNLERYGDENYNNVRKIRETILNKYGVTNVMKLESVKDKAKNTNISRYGVNHYSKSLSSIKHHHDLTYSKILLFKNVEPLFSREEFFGVTKNIQYKFKCKRCDCIIIVDLNDGNIPLCVNCDKLNTSTAQKEIYDFIKNYTFEDVLLNDRNLVYPKEIDIYIPKFKLGVEFNSFYYHSEITGNKNKLYHLRKLQSALIKGVHLVQIFEHEWSYKKDIVKSILRSKLQNFDKKIYARNCVVKEISSEESNVFLNQNHIQGKDNSRIRIGLYHEDELVSLMTFIKSRYDKKIEFEMSRFCNKLNHKVIGAASKLFHYFKVTYNPKSVVSYSDRRFFNGEVYRKLNFEFVSNTVPCYFYIKNKNIYTRMMFQKHKLGQLLEKYDSTMTEWSNMSQNGYDRIWDCGHTKWIWVSPQNS